MAQRRMGRRIAMNYEISKRLSLPVGAELWTYGDLAIKGAGKTYAACVMAEEFVKAGVPIVAIDALGIWWGLRVGIKGHEGLPVVVFGGEHKDISIPTKLEKGIVKVDEDKLKLMVKAILEARMSAVIDTSDFSKGMRRHIVTIFVAELYRLNQKYGPRHVFLEEADEWIPQRLRSGDEWGSRCFGAVDDLVRKGGNFNLGTTLITQRSAVLSKDVLTQVNCLIVLRILHKLDKEAVKTWVESVATPDDKRIAKWYDSLRDLKNGEAWIWHPEEPKLFDRIQFRERETLHATREYFTSSQFEQKDISMQDVGSFVAKFKKVFEPVKSEAKKPIEPTVVRVEKPVPAPVIQMRFEQTPERVAYNEPRHLPSLTPSAPLISPVSASQVHANSASTEISESEPVVRQFLPTIEIRQFKPIVSMSVESMDEPTSPLGRLCVVLKNAENKQAWSIRGMIAAVEEHSWPSDGIGDAAQQLIRWEILKKRSDGMWLFQRSRIVVKEASEMIQP